MGSRIKIITTSKCRKRLGIFGVLVFVFTLIFAVPLVSNAFFDTVADFASDVFDTVTSYFPGGSSSGGSGTSGFTNIFKVVTSIADFLLNGQVIPSIIAPIEELVSDAMTAIISEVIDLVDSTSILFTHKIGEFFISFASSIGWILWIIGVGISVMEVGILYKSNMGSSELVKNLGMNVFKSLLAVNLFYILPIHLYLFCSELSLTVVDALFDLTNYSFTVHFNIFCSSNNTIINIILTIIAIYTTFKIFLAVIKRAGVLLILITVGSLHMFSIPRGFWEGFWSWTKQVIALCATNFCQLIIFVAGVALLFSSTGVATDMAGLSCMLAACEVPRIAERFGMDTNIKFSASGISSVVGTIAKFAA